jgi:hypothetical protein
MADFFPKVEATQYRGSVGVGEGRLDEICLKLRRLRAVLAQLAGRNEGAASRHAEAAQRRFNFPYGAATWAISTGAGSLE